MRAAQVTASEDDGHPVLQMWDLRNTYAPAKYLEGHQRGIWALSWCSIDPSLLLTSGKDNRTLLWHTPSGKYAEVEHTSNWNTDLQWSPRLPALFATCSLEGRVRLYSLHDINPPAPSPVQAHGMLFFPLSLSLLFFIHNFPSPPLAFVV
jgi:protein transport protein SEC31